MRCSGIAAMLVLMLCGMGALAHRQQSAYPQFAYTPGGSDCPRVSQYRVAADGHETPLSPPFVSVRGSAYSLAVSPNRRSVYVPEGDFFSVAQFHVRADGTLTPMRHPHVSCSHGDICQYGVRRDGALIPLTPRAVSIAAGGVRDPSAVMFRHGGRVATVGGDDATTESVLFRFRVRADGRLVLIGHVVRRATARLIELDGMWWSDRRILTVTTTIETGLDMAAGDIHDGRVCPLPPLMPGGNVASCSRKGGT